MTGFYALADVCTPSRTGSLTGRRYPIRTGLAHGVVMLFNNEQGAGVRTQRWRLMARTHYRANELAVADWPYWLLFDLENDPAESYSVAERHLAVLADMRARYRRAVETFGPLATGPAPKAT